LEHFYKSIHGWSTSIDEVYKDFVEKAEGQKHVVEVGSWKGQSAAYMAVEILNSGKPIKFDCVDTWLGSLNEEAHRSDSAIINNTLYDEFVNNMKPVEGFYTAVRLASTEAAKLYEDASLDLVLIDANHEYDYVKEDILAWLPKVKPGGILAGHDWGWEGIVRAVNETLPNHTINIRGCCWLTTV